LDDLVILKLHFLWYVWHICLMMNFVLIKNFWNSFDINSPPLMSLLTLLIFSPIWFFARAINSLNFEKHLVFFP
jgi:hypothetical protein